jgi:hypothetical protein
MPPWTVEERCRRLIALLVDWDGSGVGGFLEAEKEKAEKNEDLFCC